MSVADPHEELDSSKIYKRDFPTLKRKVSQFVDYIEEGDKLFVYTETTIFNKLKDYLKDLNYENNGFQTRDLNKHFKSFKSKYGGGSVFLSDMVPVHCSKDDNIIIAGIQEDYAKELIKRMGWEKYTLYIDDVENLI